MNHYTDMLYLALGFELTAVRKKVKIPTLMGLTIWYGKIDNEQFLKYSSQDSGIEKIVHNDLKESYFSVLS